MNADQIASKLELVSSLARDSASAIRQSGNSRPKATETDVNRMRQALDDVLGALSLAEFENSGG